MSYVLITGASSGIGETFAEEYASQGSNLILVARSEEKLRSLSGKLAGTYGIDVRTCIQDLSLPDSAEEVFDFCNREKLQVETLVNNAGFGLSGSFDTQPLEELEKMVVLHNLTLMKLTRLFLPGMREQNRGNIINLSSIMAFLSGPYGALYAASKAFVLTFTESIYMELRNTGVKIIALCPGFTETAIFKRTDFDPHRSMLPVGDPVTVVRSAIRALEEKKPYTVPGFMNKLIIHGGRLLPRSVILKLDMILGRLKHFESGNNP